MNKAIKDEFAGLFTASQFDDRVDTHAQISNREVLGIIGRCLRLLATVKLMFVAKFLLATLALIPGLVAPWVGKLLIDQVILGKPIDEATIRFPPHVAPLIDAVQGLAPGETLLVLSLFLGAILFLLGRGGTGTMLTVGLDSATQSEGKLNAGSSQAGGLLGAVETLINIRLSQTLVNDLRTRLFVGLGRLPMATLDDHRIGDSVYRVMYDTPDVPNICFGLTLQPFFTLLGACISIYLIQYSYGAVAPELIWVSVLLIPVTLIVTLPLSGLIRRVQQASRASGTATTNAIEESMSNIHAVQSLGGMAQEKTRIEAKSKESFRRFRHVRVLQIGISVVSTLITVALAVFVTVYVTNRVIDGTMSPGDFSVLFGIALSIGGSGLTIGMVWINLQVSVAAVRRVFFFVDLPSEDDLATLPDLAEIRQGVSLDHVSFSYPNGQVALSDVTMDLRVGEMVAIVGPTGAGKTSLAHLIPAYYRPDTGTVRIDGHDLTAVNVESLRAQISYVFQEHLLMSESIFSNFRLVNPLATEADMLEACRLAEATEVIEKLPLGLHTILGRSGDTLSVGQKQRLCIARGLVRKSRVLILDEPTAALDPRTENALVATLQRAAAGRLVVVIAHRLSTIRRADRIIFLEQGKVVAVGSHNELMADAGGRYWQFVELQTGQTTAPD